MLQEIVQLHAIVYEKKIKNYHIVKIYRRTILVRCALLANSDMLVMSISCIMPIPMRILLTAAATPAIAGILIVGTT